jgi:Ca2+/Na+ antiporter
MFGMILMYAAQCIGDGGEALLELEVMPPALIGGMLLPLLGAIPDAVIILVSGMGGTHADAQKKIAVGVGTLAGSTIMLLCIAFAGSLFVARCDIGEDGEAVDETLNGEYYNSRAMGYCSKTQNMCGQLFSTGITYDHRILRIKRMMLFSSIGFLGVQIPALIWTDTDKIHTACLSMAVFSFVCLVVYLVDNVIHESHTEHHEEATHLKRTFRRGTDMAAIMRSCSQMGVDQTKANKVHEIVDQETGAVNPEGVSDLFDAFDVDKSGFLDTKETERFIKMIVKFTGDGALPSDVSTQLALAMERSRAEIVEKSSPSLALCKPTKNRNNCINKDAFVSLMVDLLQQQLEAAKKATEDEENQETEPEEAHISFWHAMGLIVLGTGLVTVFSDAMVDSIDSFGKQTGVPNFTMGFIICPYVSNASELLSSLQLAAHKKKKTNKTHNSKVPHFFHHFNGYDCFFSNPAS